MYRSVFPTQVLPVSPSLASPMDGLLLSVVLMIFESFSPSKSRNAVVFETRNRVLIDVRDKIFLCPTFNAKPTTVELARDGK